MSFRVSAHTDADFGGGQYTVQASFAEQEVAAASWTLDPAVFPIRLDVAEMMATSNANVTTTRMDLLRVVGNTSGNVVAQYSSDGELLPHIVLQPGTNGVNVQVLVDPDDPEQIIINDSGDATFSIGYRIDRHNNQTSNPCLVAPPSTQNAFPTTDVGGLQAPSQNWLFGVNCGFLGCPPNGGWSTFADLNVLCRPSGDWVMRATWTSLSCNQTLGACCLPNGTCGLETSNDCASQGGLFEGDNVPCTNVECPRRRRLLCSEQHPRPMTARRRTWQARHFVQRDRLQRGRACVPATGGCLICPPPIADWWAARSLVPAPRAAPRSASLKAPAVWTMALVWNPQRLKSAPPPAASSRAMAPTARARIVLILKARAVCPPPARA